MKRFFKTKKGVALLAAFVVVAGSAIGAYAYFTTTGAGTGSAAVGTSTAITISGTSVGSLYPGDPVGADVSFTVNNPSTGHQFVTKVHLVSVDAFTGPGFTNPIPVGVGAGSCDTSKFSMADVTENQDIPAGGPTALTVHGTLLMANDAANSQDGCKNAVLRLNLTTS
jgi:hypothetical protein